MGSGLEEALDRLLKGDVHYTKLPFDIKLLSSAKGLAEGFRRRFKRLVHIGIGGSCLGARAIVDFADGDREVVFLEGTDPESLKGLDGLLRDACVAVVSKSGRTLETVSVFSYVASVLGPSWPERTVFITSPSQENPLFRLALESKAYVLEIPGDLPGRFSVLSPVGIFPAFFHGVEGEKILEGAGKLMEELKGQDVVGRLVSNLLRYPIMVVFTYSGRLKSLSLWLSQLVAESLGKSGKGVTPVLCFGPMDQHSYLQLFAQGPDDKFYVFIRGEFFSFDPHISEVPVEGFSYLSGRRFSEIFLSEEEGTRLSLVELGREVELFTFTGSPEELGRFFMLWQVVISLTAEVMGVDPYTQDGVELGKKIIRRRLGGS